MGRGNNVTGRERRRRPKEPWFLEHPPRFVQLGPWSFALLMRSAGTVRESAEDQLVEDRGRKHGGEQRNSDAETAMGLHKVGSSHSAA